MSACTGRYILLCISAFVLIGMESLLVFLVEQSEESASLTRHFSRQRFDKIEVYIAFNLGLVWCSMHGMLGLYVNTRFRRQEESERQSYTANGSDPSDLREPEKAKQRKARDRDRRDSAKMMAVSLLLWFVSAGVAVQIVHPAPPTSDSEFLFDCLCIALVSVVALIGHAVMFSMLPHVGKSQLEWERDDSDSDRRSPANRSRSASGTRNRRVGESPARSRVRSGLLLG